MSVKNAIRDFMVIVGMAYYYTHYSNGNKLI